MRRGARHMRQAAQRIRRVRQKIVNHYLELRAIGHRHAHRAITPQFEFDACGAYGPAASATGARQGHRWARAGSRRGRTHTAGEAPVARLPPPVALQPGAKARVRFEPVPTMSSEARTQDTSAVRADQLVRQAEASSPAAAKRIDRCKALSCRATCAGSYRAASPARRETAPSGPATPAETACRKWKPGRV